MGIDREDDTMQTFDSAKNKDKLDEIIEQASKLPVENQEFILATIQGMLFTKKHMLNQNAKNSSDTMDGDKSPH